MTLDLITPDGWNLSIRAVWKDFEGVKASAWNMIYDEYKFTKDREKTEQEDLRTKLKTTLIIVEEQLGSHADIIEKGIYEGKEKGEEVLGLHIEIETMFLSVIASWITSEFAFACELGDMRIVDLLLLSTLNNQKHLIEKLREEQEKRKTKKVQESKK